MNFYVIRGSFFIKNEKTIDIETKKWYHFNVLRRSIHFSPYLKCEHKVKFQ